jgi:hypothetical protein
MDDHVGHWIAFSVPSPAMPLPIALEVVASPAPDSTATRALVEACANAAGPGGCVLSASPDVRCRARVVVTIAPDGMLARLEVLDTTNVASPALDPDGARSREIAFRDQDPPIERFRAAGLVAAGLVADLESHTLLETAPEPTWRRAPAVATLRLGVVTGWDAARPWGGAEVGVDLGIGDRWFVALSSGYQQTWKRDASGVVEQRVAFGAGAGGVASIANGHLELRARLALVVQELRASIVQPGTGREDAGDRKLAGVEAGLDLVCPVTEGFGLFAGAQAAFWADDTAVNVEGRKVENLGPWIYGFVAGGMVRWP